MISKVKLKGNFYDIDAVLLVENKKYTYIKVIDKRTGFSIRKTGELKDSGLMERYYHIYIRDFQMMINYSSWDGDNILESTENVLLEIKKIIYIESGVKLF